MGIRSILAKPFAAYIARQTKDWSMNPERYQQKVFNTLLQEGGKTLFGKDHAFESIKTSVNSLCISPSFLVKSWVAMRCADAVLTHNNIKNNALLRRTPVCGCRRDFRGLWIVVDIGILRMFSTPQYRRVIFFNP